MVRVEVVYREMHYIHIQVPREITEGDTQDFIDHLYKEHIPMGADLIAAYNEDNGDEELVAWED